MRDDGKSSTVICFSYDGTAPWEFNLVLASFDGGTAFASDS